MSRPPLAIGTYGNISRKELASGRWQAETRYRDHDGITRKVRAHGATGPKAENALKEAIRDRKHGAGSDLLTPDSTVKELLTQWLTDVDRSDRAQSTKKAYRRTVEKVITPAMGGVRLREATTGRIDAMLRAIPKNSTARDARVVLRLAFAMAARYDCVPTNPVTDAYKPPASKKRPQALTVEDLAVLRQRTHDWQTDQKLGPKRAYDLGEIIDVMLGTGGRIGEVLALRWSDIDLDTSKATFTGTVTADGKRQAWTKTDAGHREVTLPKFAVTALQRQKDRGLPFDLVFPSRNGTPRWPANIRTHWRNIRGEDYGWVTPHSMRRTVATLIEREADAEVAAAQLGHTSSAVTRKHYIERAHQAPDSSSILEQLAPTTPNVSAQ